MLRLLAGLLGLAFFGALFAGVYYEQPGRSVEQVLPSPKFRLGPGEVKQDYIEPVALGENVTVNITVLRGGPIDIFLMDMENLTVYVLNGTTGNLENPKEATFNRTVSASNVTSHHNFTFVADGENQWALVFQSRVPPLADPDNATADELEASVTEINVRMRYLEREGKSLVTAYLLVAPSIALLVYTMVLYTRRHRDRGTEGPGATADGTPPLGPWDKEL